jgi:hypothetical protein
MPHLDELIVIKSQGRVLYTGHTLENSTHTIGEQKENPTEEYIHCHSDCLILVFKNVKSGLEVSKIMNQPALTNLIKTFQNLLEHQPASRQVSPLVSFGFLKVQI